MRRASRSWFLLPTILLAACGARSELIAPDVPSFDAADVSDATDALDVRDVRDVRDVQDAHDALDVHDAPPDSAPGLPPIDTTCPGTCPYDQLTPDFPPFTPLAPPDLPAACTNGFELGGANGGCNRSTYRLRSRDPAGAHAMTLAVDFATYLQPDGVIVTGRDAAGNTYTLFQTCRLRTSMSAGPSDRRPPDETIRQFRLAVREGTTELDFDFGAVTSPMYIRVLGLCDFDVTRYRRATFWQAVP